MLRLMRGRGTVRRTLVESATRSWVDGTRLSRSGLRAVRMAGSIDGAWRSLHSRRGTSSSVRCATIIRTSSSKRFSAVEFIFRRRTPPGSWNRTRLTSSWSGHRIATPRFVSVQKGATLTP
uniref:(northern house mosquito) hypothetical protein n=1 Tax=Culex pipiens TaxID=7175 RepID=A0A8D8FIW5_CULPI